jgi:hypothetical protein
MAEPNRTQVKNKIYQWMNWKDDSNAKATRKQQYEFLLLWPCVCAECDVCKTILKLGGFEDE